MIHVKSSKYFDNLLLDFVSFNLKMAVSLAAGGIFLSRERCLPASLIRCDPGPESRLSEFVRKRLRSARRPPCEDCASKFVSVASSLDKSDARCPVLVTCRRRGVRFLAGMKPIAHNEVLMGVQSMMAVDASRA
ncbi:MAG TPA: hypothetical protein VHC19_29380, partial [Pirellulales bacterium]|nr:hypothetical protein [Pirellulales bacterium]